MKRLEDGHFPWLMTGGGKTTAEITSAQLSMLIEGLNWQKPERAWRPARKNSESARRMTYAIWLQIKTAPLHSDFPFRNAEILTFLEFKWGICLSRWSYN